MEIGAKHETTRNVLFRGKDFESCLVRRYPCSFYLDAGSWELMQWFAREYTRVVPKTERNSFHQMDETEFKEECIAQKGSVHHVKLRRNETLADMSNIVERILGTKPPYSSSSSSDSSSSEDLSDSDDSEDSYTDSEPDEWEWVLCVDKDWHRVMATEPFKGNKEYKLVWLENGNMLRMKVSDFGTNITCTSDTKPTHCPDISSYYLLRRQIYIYNCMDGFWEFDPEHQGPLFPCNNPPDKYYSRGFDTSPSSSTSTVSSLLCASGMLTSEGASVMFDIPSADELIQTMLVGGESSGGDSTGTESEDVSSDEEPEPVPRIKEHKHKKTTMSASKLVPRPAISFDTITPTDEWINPLVGKNPRDIAKRQSGVQGVSWHSRDKGVCMFA